MFRKIVTELAYSPALAGNLGHYIKQLRNEASRRQIGLIFIALAITIQLFATIFPPESANANNPTILIDGGIQSVDEYLSYYDQNTSNIKDLLDSLGITRSEIQAAKLTEISPSANLFLWSAQNTRVEGSVAHFFTKASTEPGVAYYQPFFQTMPLPAYIGSSAQLGGEFAITQDGASLLTSKPTSQCGKWLSSPNTSLRVSSWFTSYEPECQSLLDLSLSAHEISSSSQEIGTLSPSSRIAYTVSIKNKSEKTISMVPSINLEDALEYSRILDYGGSGYNFDTKNLTWPTLVLEAGGSLERTFIMQLSPTIPATASGRYVDRSYDCEVALTFGTNLSNPVTCPPAKYIERMADNLPSMSLASNIIASVLLVIFSVFLYARSRQLLTELYIIRHNHVGGS